MFIIRPDNLSSTQTRALLTLHLAGMHENSPPGSVFALDLSGLEAPNITVWSAWRDSRIASIGALALLPDGNAELKSMRTHPDFIRQGAAAKLLETIIGQAQAKGAQRISLETGSGPAFNAALALYQRRGFQLGAAFSSYVQTDFNQFLHLALPSQPHQRLNSTNS